MHMTAKTALSRLAIELGVVLALAGMKYLVEWIESNRESPVDPDLLPTA